MLRWIWNPVLEMIVGTCAVGEASGKEWLRRLFSPHLQYWKLLCLSHAAALRRSYYRWSYFV